MRERKRERDRQTETDRLTETEKGIGGQFSFKGRERAAVNQTNSRTVSKATMEKHLRDSVVCSLWAFPSA